ncbi:hypothetical protein WJX73_007957 [Symbiochloris irregularis]|uniref:Transcription initiation factor IIF subunit alpha n=1 Tax=Symbiochloris irregularis TaxID=706552 RepID=A0AAW1NUC3_9CHLO
MSLPTVPGEEIEIRTCAASQASSGVFLGRFSSVLPGFIKQPEGGDRAHSASRQVTKDAKNWSVQRQEVQLTKAQKWQERKNPRPATHRPWVLLGDDQPSHVGHVEGGLGGSNANASYFLLVPSGGHFTAVPVKEWYNFKPAPKGTALSLEDAEKAMSNPGRQFRGESQLGAKAASKTTEDEAGGAPGADKDDDSDDDIMAEADAGDAPAWAQAEETEDAKPKEAALQQAQRPSAAVKQQGDPDGPEGAEDWEHKEERADDDLEMGEEGNSDQDSPRPAGAGTSPRTTGSPGGTGSPEPEGSEGATADEDADDDDIEDLDAMADGMASKGLRAPTPKARTPSPAPATLSRPPSAAGKRVRSRTPTAEPGPQKKVKREPTPQGPVASVPSASAPRPPTPKPSRPSPSPAPTSAAAEAAPAEIREADITGALTRFGPMKMDELLKRLGLKKADLGGPGNAARKKHFLRLLGMLTESDKDTKELTVNNAIGAFEGFKLELPELKDIDIEYATVRSPQGWAPSLSACPKLETFSSHKLWGLGLENGKTHRLRLPNCRLLGLWRADDIDSLELTAPKLERLDLQGCYSIRHVQLANGPGPQCEVVIVNANLPRASKQHLLAHPRAGKKGLITRDEVLTMMGGNYESGFGDYVSVDRAQRVSIQHEPNSFSTELVDPDSNRVAELDERYTTVTRVTVMYA